MSASIATDDTPNVTLNVTDRVLCFIHIGKTTDTIIIDNKNHMTLFFLLPKHNKARLVDRASDNSLQGASVNVFRALGHYHPLGNGLRLPVGSALRKKCISRSAGIQKLVDTPLDCS